MLAVPATAAKLSASVVAVPAADEVLDCIACTVVVTWPNNPVPVGDVSVKFPRSTKPDEGIVPVCNAETLRVVPSSKKFVFTEIS